MFRKFFLSAFVLILSFIFYGIYEAAEAANVSAPSQVIITDPLDVKILDFQHVVGGDYIYGLWYSEEEILELINKHPNVERIIYSGQLISPNISIMQAIHDKLPYLKEMTIKGSIRFWDGDGLAYSWETINLEEVNAEMLMCLLGGGSSIESLDFSLSSIDDEGLGIIAEIASELREINLSGAASVTDEGIYALVSALPQLKYINLSKYHLWCPLCPPESVGPNVSEQCIQDLINLGIEVNI